MFLPSEGSVNSQEINRVHGIQRFTTAFTSDNQLSLSSARPIQSMPHPSHFLKIHFNLTLPNGEVYKVVSLPRASLPKHLYNSPLCHSCTCLAYLLFLDVITQILFGKELCYVLLCSPLHPASKA